MYPQWRRGNEPWACHDNPMESPPLVKTEEKWNYLNRWTIECYTYEHAQSEENLKLVRQR